MQFIMYLLYSLLLYLYYCIIVSVLLYYCICIIVLLYLYYDDNIPPLKPNAHKLKDMYHNTLSPWNTNMYQTNCINTNTPLNSIVIAPVVKCHNNVHVLRPHSSLGKNESQKAIHSACDFEDNHKIL